MSQMKAMFHRKRVFATLMYLATLIATLAVAFGVPNTQADGVTPTNGKGMGIVALVVLQFVALVWYTLSYIPFARDLMKKGIASCFSGLQG